VGTEADDNDVLSMLLGNLRAQDVVLGHFQLSADWAFERDAVEGCAFRTAIGRRFYLQVAGQPLLTVESGDLVVLPHGCAHTILSSPGANPVPFERLAVEFGHASFSQRPLVFSAGEPGERTELLAGIVTYLAGETDALIRMLPEVIHISADRMSPASSLIPSRTPWLATTLRTLVDESLARKPGWKASARRLVEVVLVDAFRVYFATIAEDAGILKGLTHPQVARAMLLMHEEPAAQWTVDTLSAAVGMSRSRFAGKFAELVGMPPMAYLAEQRLAAAATMLASAKRRSVAAIASAVGYQSEKGFARAFTKKFGEGPATFARRSSDRA
jgi:AraC-like DNA-binding protein